MRGAICSADEGRWALQGLLRAVFNAIWVDSLNMNDPATAAQALTRAGFDAQALVALATDQGTKNALKAATQVAVDRGIFRCPDFLRRRSDVLGAGPDGFRKGSVAVNNTANRQQSQVI